jgi:hypothetical protein
MREFSPHVTGGVSSVDHLTSQLSQIDVTTHQDYFEQLLTQIGQYSLRIHDEDLMGITVRSNESTELMNMVPSCFETTYSCVMCDHFWILPSILAMGAVISMIVWYIRSPYS